MNLGFNDPDTAFATVRVLAVPGPGRAAHRKDTVMPPRHRWLPLTALTAAALLTAACASAIDGEASGTPAPATSASAPSPEPSGDPAGPEASGDPQPDEPETSTVPEDPPPGPDDERPSNEAHGPSASMEWTVIPGAAFIDNAPVINEAELAASDVASVVVPAAHPDGSDGQVLYALSLPSQWDPSSGSVFDIMWLAEYDGSCDFDLVMGSAVLAPILDESGKPGIQVGYGGTDRPDEIESFIYEDPVVIPQPGRATSCSTVAGGTMNSPALLAGATQGDDGEPLIFWAGDEELGEAVEDAHFEQVSVPTLVAGPVTSLDGTMWTLHDVNGELMAARLGQLIDAQGDPTRGGFTIADEQVASGTLIPTSNGFVVLTASGPQEAHLVRAGRDGTLWSIPLPSPSDTGDPFFNDGTGPMSWSDNTIALVTDTGQVVVIDDYDATVQASIAPVGGGAGLVAVHGPLVVVSPVDGGAWADGYDGVTGELLWSAYAPDDVGAAEVKSIVSLGAFGVLVQAESAEGLIVALIQVEVD